MKANEANLEAVAWPWKVAAMGIGAILIRSAVVHLENSYAFLASVYAYDLVGRKMGVGLAIVLPAVQLAIGAMLIFSPDSRWFSLRLSAVLFGTFTVVQIATLSRGLNIDCGCFGSSLPNPIGWTSISFVAALCLLSIAAATWGSAPRKTGASQADLNGLGAESHL